MHPTPKKTNCLGVMHQTPSAKGVPCGCSGYRRACQACCHQPAAGGPLQRPLCARALETGLPWTQRICPRRGRRPRPSRSPLLGRRVPRRCESRLTSFCRVGSLISRSSPRLSREGDRQSRTVTQSRTSVCQFDAAPYPGQRSRLDLEGSIAMYLGMLAMVMSPR